MSMSDPIADMLTQIRNSQASYHKSVKFYSSKIKLNIARLLQSEGYVNGVRESEDSVKKVLTIDLKYHNGKGVIEYVKRASKPGLRSYKSSKKLPKVMGGLGIAVVSTSKGLMTDHQARKENLGGEIICMVA